METEFSERDWNFDNVPDEELAACCLWEYARESISFERSSRQHAEITGSFRRGERPDTTPDSDYSSFLGAYWNCDEGYMEFYETIRNYGGPAALPWKWLAKQNRQQLCQQVGIHGFSGPISLAMRFQLEDLWKNHLKDWGPQRNEPGYDRDEDSVAYELTRILVEEAGHGGETHGNTLAAFVIDFRKYNDKQISGIFREWLKANRPKDCPEPTERGRKLRDSGVALDRLGIMRLLHHFTLKEMPKCCPGAWKAFAGYEWYKERKRAGVAFKKLFRFLPKTERPLSWPTKGGRSK